MLLRYTTQFHADVYDDYVRLQCNAILYYMHTREKLILGNE